MINIRRYKYTTVHEEIYKDTIDVKYIMDLPLEEYEKLTEYRSSLKLLHKHSGVTK